MKTFAQIGIEEAKYAVDRLTQMQREAMSQGNSVLVRALSVAMDVAMNDHRYWTGVQKDEG